MATEGCEKAVMHVHFIVYMIRAYLQKTLKVIYYINSDGDRVNCPEAHVKASIFYA